MDLEKELKDVETKAQDAINKRKELIDQAGVLEAEIVRFQGEYRALKRLMEPEKKDETA